MALLFNRHDLERQFRRVKDEARNRERRRCIVIHAFPNFDPPIARLFELANTSFVPRTFRRACERFATFDAGSSHDDLWYFSVSGGPNLIVAVETEPIERKANSGPKYRQLAVSCAILSVCWWETFLKSEHESLLSWKAERATFDRFYTELLGDTIEVLGPPLRQGTDADEDRHQQAIWRGETGLMILQQSAYDPQFGLDVNYWVQRWSGSDPHPTSPFIDWLCGLPSPRQATTY